MVIFGPVVGNPHGLRVFWSKGLYILPSYESQDADMCNCMCIACDAVSWIESSLLINENQKQRNDKDNQHGSWNAQKNHLLMEL